MSEEYSRRAFLRGAGGAAAAVTGLSGCLGDSGPTYTQGETEVYEIDTVVNENDYGKEEGKEGWWPFEFEFPHGGEIEYTVEVEKGPRVETMVLDYDKYDEFADQGLFDSDGGDKYDLNRHSNTRLRDSGELPAGEYVFLIDNTRRGDTNPPDDAWQDSPEEKNDKAKVSGEIRLTPTEKK